MLSQLQNTQTCALCNGTNFYIDAGYYFCSNCQTQNEDIREEVFEVRYDATTRLRKTKIRTEKLEKDIIGWTSWELYNFVLIGLANELVEIGLNPSIKLTILQLWTSYLSKLEVAFTSKTKKCVPKMARRYHKKDAEIIYGKIQQKKKRRRKKLASNASASSAVTSYRSENSTSTRELNKSKRLLVASEYDKYLKIQASSDTDGLNSLNQTLYSLKSSISETSSTGIRIRFNKKAKLEARKVRALSKKVPRGKRMIFRKKHITTRYAIGPDVITPLKLWAIIYLASRINNQDIYLSDMLRFSREGHLSYYKLDHLLPPEVSLTKTDINLLTQSVDITHKGLRRTAASIAKFLNVSEIPKPKFLGLIRRYCEELELPKGILLYAERLFLSACSVMQFTANSPLIPNYEGRAMAYIIVVLKTLFGLDDVTEKAISRVIEKINREASDKRILTAKLFSFCEWQRFIECRKSVLVNLHFPSKIKYDPECAGNSHLYLRFMGLMKSKQEAEAPEIVNFKHVMSKNLVGALYQCLDKLNDNSIPFKEMEVFPPSFTPLRFYTTQLIDNPHYDLPHILRSNFYETKIGYTSKPDFLVDLASQCGIKLDVVDHSLHFLEKVVPPFEQPRMPSVKELSELVKVEASSKSIIYSSTKIQNENLLNYSHRNRLCKMKVNLENLNQYSKVSNMVLELDDSLDFNEDSCFDMILPDGRLNISEEIDSEKENVLNKSKSESTIVENSSCLLNKDFCKKYSIKLYNHEVDSLVRVKKLKEKYSPCRDARGKFVKSSSRSLTENKKSTQKKKYSRIIGKSIDESSTDEENIHRARTKKKDIKEVSQTQLNDDTVEVPMDCFDFPDLDISILDDTATDEVNLNNLSINENEIFFRPYKDYWMYHCIFSRVKEKNFELFEKELPENFLWLLNECANIVEMTTKDLYEEVCLIEAYHINILKNKDSKHDADYAFHDCKSKSYSNNILNKW